ncbi:MAG TPA: protein-disulfide reductase DsbD domain-containing protein [Hyphomicrobiaceae bacterium]|nr:protein-disulfide reductase DsbD domain-containing protein [Hyphomicrobiaceae bacterium]
MSRFPIAACASVVFALAAVGLAAAQAQVPIGIASPWVELHTARVRLVAGAAAAKGAKSYLAGVEITLADGWKTYWRNPGDAGVPPIFDWSGSTNVASMKVLYPAPSRLKEPGAETIGYTQAVLFPVEVTPEDAKKPVELKLLLEFGICREICIPAQSTLSLAIPTEALAGEPPSAILAALSRVPRPQAERRRDDPELGSMTASLDGPSPRLAFEVRFAGDGKGGDLFIEAPDGLYVPMPKRLPDAADGTARFEVDLSRAGIARDFKGKTLTLTLVSDEGASEAVRVVE